MHISLVEKPSRKYILRVLDYYNWISFHSIVVQAIFDVENFFWNVCANQLGRVHDGVNSKVLNYTRRWGLNKFSRSMKMTPYLIGDSTYHTRICLQKNWKSCNPNDVNKKRYDNNMNFEKVIIKEFLGLWRIGGESWNFQFKC
jgi:hypothetical protein